MYLSQIVFISLVCCCGVGCMECSDVCIVLSLPTNGDRCFCFSHAAVLSEGSVH